MSVININCNDQALTITNMPLITSGDIGIDSVAFNFCPLWKGWTKTAVFWRNTDNVYYQVLDSNDSCIIPKEVLADSGILYLSVFGVDENENVRTAEILRYNIKAGAITENLQAPDSTSEIWAQLLAAYAKCQNDVADKANKVENATSGNFAGLDANGNLTDSGSKAEDFQPETNGLTTEAGLTTGDYIPFYDVSAKAHRKSTWSNIISKIRTAFFGSSNGLLKANGSGTISATKIGDETLAGWTIASAVADVAATDTLNVAIGKLEKARKSQSSPIGNANGILKADGQGNVSAAVAGTDYQAPLNAGTDYATPTIVYGAVSNHNAASNAHSSLFAAKYNKPIRSTNVSVATSAFVANSTYADYGYRASVAITGATANMIPEVTFSLTDAISGILAPIAECYAGGVYIYASEVPSAAVTIATVTLWKEV